MIDQDLLTEFIINQRKKDRFFAVIEKLVEEMGNQDDKMWDIILNAVGIPEETAKQSRDWVWDLAYGKVAPKYVAKKLLDYAKNQKD
jgi:hypothetical protein